MSNNYVELKERADARYDNMTKTIKEAYPDYDLSFPVDMEMLYYDALKKITIEKDKALRYNDGKLKWSMVHFASLRPMVKVLMYGEKKYARDNWKKGLDRHEILDSMQRHLAALIDGEEIDPESQEHHIGHILCNCMFYSYFNVISEDKSFE